MLGKFQDMMKQLQAMQRLAKDARFKTLLAHPKVQELMRDPDFQAIVKSQDMAKIASHPKFAALMSDPAFIQLIATLNPKPMSQDAA